MQIHKFFLRNAIMQLSISTLIFTSSHSVVTHSTSVIDYDKLNKAFSIPNKKCSTKKYFNLEKPQIALATPINTHHHQSPNSRLATQTEQVKKITL